MSPDSFIYQYYSVALRQTHNCPCTKNTKYKLWWHITNILIRLTRFLALNKIYFSSHKTTDRRWNNIQYLWSHLESLVDFLGQVWSRQTKKYNAFSSWYFLFQCITWIFIDELWVSVLLIYRFISVTENHFTGKGIIRLYGYLSVDKHITSTWIRLKFMKDESFFLIYIKRNETNIQLLLLFVRDCYTYSYDYVLLCGEVSTEQTATHNWFPTESLIIKVVNLLMYSTWVLNFYLNEIHHFWLGVAKYHNYIFRYFVLPITKL